jgi:hypothetical protein
MHEFCQHRPIAGAHMPDDTRSNAFLCRPTFTASWVSFLGASACRDSLGLAAEHVTRSPAKLHTRDIELPTFHRSTDRPRQGIRRDPMTQREHEIPQPSLKARYRSNRRRLQLTREHFPAASGACGPCRIERRRDRRGRESRQDAERVAEAAV